MARLSESRIAWTYTADNGTQYRMAAVAAYTSQDKQGGADGSAVAAVRPSNFKPRRVSVRNATLGISRVVPLYEAGAPLASEGETITLNHDTDSYVFVSDGNPLPEQHLIKNATRQTT